MSSSVECVKYRQERFGLAFGLYQVMVFNSLNPNDCIAKPTEKITCCVPETQIVPDGLSTRWQACSHALVKRWSSSTPCERSQPPFPTGARLPPLQVKPPLDRKYGGSANTRSNEP